MNRRQFGALTGVRSWIAMIVPYFFVTPANSTEALDGSPLAESRAAAISRERTASQARDHPRRAQHGENSHRSGLRKGRGTILSGRPAGKR